MRAVAIVVSCAGLALTVVPSFYVMTGCLSWVAHVQMMFAGMILWFVSAPFWIKKD